MVVFAMKQSRHVMVDAAKNKKVTEVVDGESLNSESKTITVK